MKKPKTLAELTNEFDRIDQILGRAYLVYDLEDEFMVEDFKTLREKQRKLILDMVKLEGK